MKELIAEIPKFSSTLYLKNGFSGEFLSCFISQENNFQ